MAFASPVAANTDGVDLDEVIVIASRRPVGSDDLSTALSLIDREDVLLRKLTTDALASNVGVTSSTIGMIQRTSRTMQTRRRKRRSTPLRC